MCKKTIINISCSWVEVNRSFNDPRKILNSNCEKCKKERLQFVHTIYHPEYMRDLYVCRTCAEEMTNDFVKPLEKENELKRARRRHNFCNGNWVYNPDKRTYTRKYKGRRITIQNVEKGNWGVHFRNSSYWKWHNRRITSFEDAKMFAFDVFEDNT